MQTHPLVNIVFETKGNWILPRLARALAKGLPYAEAVHVFDTSTIKGNGARINYYLNDDSMVARSGKMDVVFFDHPKHDYKSLARADHAIAMAPQYQHEIAARGTPCDLVTVPVDTAAYSPRLIVGFVGRFRGRTDYGARKGRDILERVAALPWVELRQTQGKIAEADMPDFYRACDAILCPGDPEGGPMALFEALACGKPVIMPHSVGCAEMFAEEVIDYPSGDFRALQTILERLHEPQRKRAARVERYTWAYWVEQHRRIFDRLLTEHDMAQECKRAVVVIATPEVDEMAAITLPAIRAYADRCRAKLIVLRDCPPEYQHPKYRIMALRHVKAERVLHLDADCFPLQDAPDIFDAHPAGYIYMWHEREIRKPREIERFQAGIEQHTGKTVDWDGAWWNPGVMLCDRAHLDLFDMPPWDVADADHLWYGNTVKNQPFLNWRLCDRRMHPKPLDRSWNCITSLPDSDTESACILHFGAEKIPDAWQRKLAMAKKFSTPKPPRVLMATVVSGESFEELFSLIEPYHRAYADAHGYDYCVIREPIRQDWPSPSWWKLDLINAFNEGYDAVFFCDADAWPKPGAPSIVDVVPRGKFGAFNSSTLPYMVRDKSHAMLSYRQWLADSGIDMTDTIDPKQTGIYINGGVWVCWKDAKHILECDKPVESRFYVEQHQLCINLYNNPGLYHELPRAWNYGHPHRPDAFHKMNTDAAHIVHLNGPIDKKRYLTNMLAWPCMQIARKKVHANIKMRSVIRIPKSVHPGVGSFG